MIAAVYRLPLDLPPSQAKARALYSAFRALADDLAARWPKVGVEDMRKVVAAYDEFSRAMWP